MKTSGRTNFSAPRGDERTGSLVRPAPRILVVAAPPVRTPNSTVWSNAARMKPGARAVRQPSPNISRRRQRTAWRRMQRAPACHCKQHKYQTPLIAQPWIFLHDPAPRRSAWRHQGQHSCRTPGFFAAFMKPPEFPYDGLGLDGGRRRRPSLRFDRGSSTNRWRALLASKDRKRMNTVLSLDRQR